MTKCFWRNSFVDMPLEHTAVVCQGAKSWILIIALATLIGHPIDQAQASNGEGVPCLYEGKLKTEQNWFGYLANITIMTTGSMLFRFSYPADKCCQNVLFYSENQMAIISARMNCWQKEYLLRPEDDQILRLTPRFAWSGCRMIHPNGVATYTCAGGRSFTTTNNEDRPTTWYVAVSNCAALHGLDLQYQLEVYGHIGECPHLLTTTLPTTTMTMPKPKMELVPITSSATQVNDDKNVCVIENTVNSTSKWYGFIANMSLNAGGGFRFSFTYPYEMQVQNVILYSEDDVAKLDVAKTCWQKDGLIRTRNVPDQILDLSYRSSWNGCVSRNTTTGKILQCRGERRYEQPRKVYMAVSNCRGINGLFLDYHLEVSGFTGDLCRTGSGSSIHSALLFPTFRTLASAGPLWCILFSVVFSCWLIINPSVMLSYCEDSCRHNYEHYYQHEHKQKNSQKPVKSSQIISHTPHTHARNEVDSR